MWWRRLAQDQIHEIELTLNVVECYFSFAVDINDLKLRFFTNISFQMLMVYLYKMLGNFDVGNISQLQNFERVPHTFDCGQGLGRCLT